MSPAAVNNPTPAAKKFARVRPICFNAPPSIDRDAARRFMVQWIAERAVQIYRRKHANEG